MLIAVLALQVSPTFSEVANAHSLDAVSMFHCKSKIDAVGTQLWVSVSNELYDVRACDQVRSRARVLVNHTYQVYYETKYCSVSQVGDICAMGEFPPVGQVFLNCDKASFRATSTTPDYSSGYSISTACHGSGGTCH